MKRLTNNKTVFRVKVRVKILSVGIRAVGLKINVVVML